MPYEIARCPPCETKTDRIERHIGSGVFGDFPNDGRRFILAMLMIEAIVVGIIFGGLGAGIGAVIVATLGKVGIPAPNDVSYFFFSGPRLHLVLSSANLVKALVIVFVVSAVSSFYPAWLAMRVSPRQAMQSEES